MLNPPLLEGLPAPQKSTYLHWDFGLLLIRAELAIEREDGRRKARRQSSRFVFFSINVQMAGGQPVVSGQESVTPIQDSCVCSQTLETLQPAPVLGLQTEDICKGPEQ